MTPDFDLANEKWAMQDKNYQKMSVRCKSCGKNFDSTFTVAEYESLPREQYEAGTLHLCPDCGHLATYLLKDYTEQTK